MSTPVSDPTSGDELGDQHVHLIADSGHAFKMTGLGKLAARPIASGAPVREL